MNCGWQRECRNGGDWMVKQNVLDLPNVRFINANEYISSMT
jgi:hypothetical protein